MIDIIGIHRLPHNTVIIVRWPAADTLPGEDSQAVTEWLKIRSEDGLTEALADPIVS